MFVSAAPPLRDVLVTTVHLKAYFETFFGEGFASAGRGTWALGPMGPGPLGLDLDCAASPPQTPRALNNKYPRTQRINKCVR